MQLKKMLPALALAVAGFVATSHGAAVYTQTSATGLTTSTATLPTALDDIHFATGSAAATPVLSGLTFGVGVAPSTTAQSAVVFVDFYDIVNMASTGLVESSYLGGFGGTLSITANTSTTTTALRAFTFSSLNTLSTPIIFTDDDIGVVITLANSTGASYSTILTPLMSIPGAPTVGSSTTGVYRDLSGDGDFQAAEFNPAFGNLYLSISAIAPEPSSLGLLAPAALALVRRRRA